MSEVPWRFIEVVGDQITVDVESKPIEDKANRELIRRLAKHVGLSSSQVKMISGRDREIRSLRWNDEIQFPY